MAKGDVEHQERSLDIGGDIAMELKHKVVLEEQAATDKYALHVAMPLRANDSCSTA